MESNLITIKEVALKNNCPECYTKEGLQLSFKQKLTDTKLYKFMASDVIEELACKKCETTIYPVRWTDDIERSYDYQKKAFTPKASNLKFKPLAWALFIAVDLLILGAILYFAFPEVLGLE